MAPCKTHNVRHEKKWAAALNMATLQIAQLTHITRTLIDINAYSWKPSVEHVLLDLAILDISFFTQSLNE